MILLNDISFTQIPDVHAWLASGQEGAVWVDCSGGIENESSTFDIDSILSKRM